ncbi:MAG: 50S ribosomal protein L10 [Candidatus Levybacteria bacterium]|nr:50S ribosomal protein L10 [Candidatus Levybacteria bacterium]MBI3070302.1 50S ribosomal protein L10 [Candidatus Levybacteria bacterium]
MSKGTEPTSPRIGASRAKKEKIVAEIAEKVGKAKALFFANYQGMTHKQLEELKKALRAVGAELVVTKNTLLARVLQTTDYRPQPAVDGRQLTVDSLQGPTATLFAYEDPLLPLKALAKSIKTLKLPIIKFGIFEGKLLAEAEVIRLSTLPSREVLLTQLVIGMKAPLFGLHRALNWNMQRFVLTLKTIEDKKNS